MIVVAWLDYFHLIFRCFPDMPQENHLQTNFLSLNDKMYDGRPEWEGAVHSHLGNVEGAQPFKAKSSKISQR